MFLDALIKNANNDKIAVYCGYEGISYRDLYKRTKALAWYLYENYNKDQPVLIFGDKECDMIVCIFASIIAKKKYVIVPNYTPKERFNLIFNDCNPGIILMPTESEMPFDLSIITSNNINEFAEIYKDYGPLKDIEYDLNQVIALMYTSGSSGKPKAVQMTYRNLESKVRRGIIDLKNYANNGQYTEMCLSSYGYSASLAYLYVVGALGGTFVTVPKSIIVDTKKLFEFMKHYKPNGFAITPTLAEKLMSFPDFSSHGLPDMTILCLGGEPLFIETGKKMLERFPNIKLFNTYATTETIAVGITCNVSDTTIKASESYLPVSDYGPDINLYYLINEQGNIITKENEIGEFVFYGDMVADGYYNDIELTKEKFFNLDNNIKAYRTGDLGVIRNGYTFLIGRADNQVKIGGNRIEIEEVEANLLKCSIVEDAAAVVTKENNQSILIAFVVLNDRNKDLKSIQAFLQIKKELKENVESHMIPQKLLFVDELPKNTNGKIDRPKLYEMVKENSNN